jgi:hypothetical protein
MFEEMAKEGCEECLKRGRGGMGRMFRGDAQELPNLHSKKEQTRDTLQKRKEREGLLGCFRGSPAITDGVRWAAT